MALVPQGSPSEGQIARKTPVQDSQARKLAPTHNFTAKLRQPSLLPRVLDYVAWQKETRRAKEAGSEAPPMPDWAPLSINLDLTTACNYRCDHCIDWDILNSPIKYEHEKLEASLANMAERGLKSVILIGGGEPTIYPGFVDMVRFLKNLGLQVAIVSNGSRNDLILSIMDVLEEGDWVRLSLDSGSNETFRRMHKPVKDLSLDAICELVPQLRAKNPKVLVGFSFIIVWQGAEREEGVQIVENIHEIYEASERAKRYGFSYISLKPFLSRRESGAEVMDPEGAEAELTEIIQRIRAEVDHAKQLESETFRVIESINLKVLEAGTWREYTRQPKTCHMQVMRQVLSPLGLYNCPAHRGVPKALIAGPEGFVDTTAIAATQQATTDILEDFNAAKNCSEVTCLYNSVNWYLEEAITGVREISREDALPERFDSFL